MQKKLHTHTMDKIWTPPFIVIMIALFFSGSTFSMITPVIAKYSIHIGASMTASGIVSGCYAAAALVVHPVSGLLCDTLNNRKLLLFSITGTFLSILGYSIATNVVFLIILRILHGLFFGISSVAGSAMALQYVPQSRLAEGVGYVGLANVLSQAIGPSIALALTERISYSLFFVVVAFMALAAVVILAVSKINDSKDGRLQDIHFTLKGMLDKRILFYGFANALFSISNGLCNTYLAMMAEERAIAGASIFFVVVSCVLFFTRPIAGKLTDKVGANVVVLAAYVIAAVALFMLASAKSLPMLLVAAVFKALAQGSGQPALQAICIRKMGPEKRGVATSTWLLGGDIGNSVGPMMGGSIAEVSGYGTMYISGGILASIGLVLFSAYQALTGQMKKKKAVEE